MSVYNASVIEYEIKHLIRDTLGISDKVYGNRPKASMNAADSFVVARVTGNMDDMAAYGRCTLSIHLYAKDAQYEKNAVRLGLMQKALIDGMPRMITCPDAEFLIDDCPTVVGDLADDFGFHARIIRYNITLKAI